MANFFRATALFFIGSLFLISGMVLRAYAEQVSSQGMSLQQFQQWMQQQNTPSASRSSRQAVPQTGGQPPIAIPSQVMTQTTAQPVDHILSLPRSQPKPAMIRERRAAYRRSFNQPMTYAESRQAMLRSVPAPLTPPIEGSQYVFNTMLQQNMPLTPQQVVKLHQQIDISQRAAATPPLVPPKPVSTTLMINLAPGTTPPAIRLALGYVTSLVFVDSTGSPWPIAAFDIGSPKSVNMQWDGKSNILLIQAVTSYSYGDMVVRLVGLPTPITLELVSGQRVVDYRVDLHISGIGPNTKELPTDSLLPSSANTLLLSVLDGVAPPGSRTLIVRGADCQAWLLGDKIFSY